MSSGVWLAAGLSYAALGAPHPAPGAERMAISGATALCTGQVVLCRAVSWYLLLLLAVFRQTKTVWQYMSAKVDML